MKTLQDTGVSLATILDHTDNLVQVLAPDGSLLYANARWFDVLAYTADTASSLNFIQDILESSQQHAFITRLERIESPETARLLLRKAHDQFVAVSGTLIPQFENDRLQTITCILTPLPDPVETEFSRMFMMSVDMLGVVDFAGRFELLNPAWETVLGYSLDELIGEQFITFLHPDDVQHTLEAAAQTQNAGTIQTFTNRYLTKNGAVVWLSWYYLSYPELRKTYFVARDVTEQRSQQERLRETRDQLQSILDNSGTIVGLKDLNGVYSLVNQEFADQFGNGDKNAIVGLTDSDLFPPVIAQTLIANDEAVKQSGEAKQFEESLPGEQELRTYLTTKFLLYDRDGNPSAVCMIAKDITYRKLTEVQLALRNQAIEYSPSGISIADARLHDMPLIYINPAFEANTGYSALDVIGRNCRFLQGEDRDQPAIAEVREAIEAEQPVTVVLRNYRKDGKLFYNELSLAPIHDENGDLTHYVGISTDVTERVRFEEHIQHQNEALVEANRRLAQAHQDAANAAEKINTQYQALRIANRDLADARKQAEDATRLKSQFLATMSHELRTPLNAIIGYTEIQLAGMTGDLSEEQRDYQNRVLANAEHLLELINDVLDISKIEAGRMELVWKAFNLPEWVSDVTSQMRVLADKKDIEFRVRLDERMPEIIVGDPARIRQIVINLLSNAIKFTSEGHVGLYVRKHGRDAWKVIVEDTGPGIPSHQQETVFEEFRQLDGSSQRKVGGTGLGLSIVRKLSLMMGGNIRLKSQAGMGSTFTIILPLEQGVMASDE